MSIAWDGFSRITKDKPQQGTSAAPSYEPTQRAPNHVDSVLVTARLNVEADDGVLTAISLGNTPATVDVSSEAGKAVVQATISGLGFEENFINIRVVPPVGDAADYVIKLNRRHSSRLIHGAILGAALTPAFDPGIFQYGATVPNYFEQVSLFIASNPPGATVFVNDAEEGSLQIPVTVDPGRSRLDLSIPNIGVNIIPLRVTASGEKDTIYTIRVNRQYSLDLRALAVTDPDNIAISPSFTAERSEYTATVPDTTEQITVAFSTDLDVAFDIEANTLPTATSTRMSGENGKEDVEATVPLNFDENPIAIRVSAAGEESVTTLTITRLRGSNPNLKAQPNGLSVSEGTVSYDETNQIYRVDVKNNVERLRMTLMPQDTNVVEIALDGISLDLGSLKGTREEVSAVIADLIVGNNIKALMITAHDTETTQSYTLIVNRAMSTDDKLSGFGFSLFAGESSVRTVGPQDFDPETLMYTLPDVEEEINRIKATLVSSDDNAKIEIRKSDGSYSTVERGMQSDFINLSLGENVIEIKVTAPDEITSRVYTVNMRRRLSTNTDLSEAPRVGSNLADRVAGSNNYFINIDEDTLNFTVAATAAHSGATVMISGGGNADVRGSPSATKDNISINREIAPVTITIVVISQSGTTSQTYSLIVNLAQSSETRLTSLSAGAGATALTVVENQTAYTASIGEEISETTVTAVARDSKAVVIITVDDVSTQATGSVSRRIAIDETGGSKSIRISVRAEDGTLGGYTLTVSRDESSNACLSSLQVVSKDPMISSVRDNLPCNGRSIEFSVQNAIAEVVLRPTAADEEATVKVFAPGDTAGEVIARGEESSRPIPIPEGGAVTARIEVSAQDSSVRNYQVLINRGGSSDANLKGLQLLGSNREQLLTFSDSNQEHYEVSIPNIIRVATVIATAHDKAAIELILDGTSSTGTGVIRDEFELEPDNPDEITKQIRIVITSQNESTTRAYTMRVTRARQDNSNAELGSIGLSVPVNNPLNNRVIILPSAMKGSEDATSYTATIRDIAELEVQDILRVRVSPRAADSEATISVDGEPAESNPSLDFRLAAALDEVNTPIMIKVIAEDGMTSQTYSLVITRESSADTRLESLRVGSEALEINDALMEYRASIDEHTMNTTVTVTARHSQALVTISGGGGSDVNGNARSASKKISLATGESKELKIVVTAQDRTTTRGYIVRVTRDQSSDVQLANITVAGTTAAAESSTEFTATVGENAAMPAVIVNARHSRAMVTIREAGSEAVNGVQRASKAISIANPGDSKVINIVVTAQNTRVSQEYALTVTRAKSSDAYLNKLELLLQPSGAAEVIFDSISSTQSYALMVDNAVASVKVKPTANSDYAYKMEVFAPDNAAGEQIVAGGESSEIPLTDGGSTEIKIVVTAQDEVTTRGYIVRVTRALSSDANLSTLSVVPGTLEPSFTPEGTVYAVRDAIVESFVLTVGAKVNQAVSIALNNAAPELLIASNAESRSASRSIALEYGENTLTIEVTASDETSKTYIVTAVRPVFLNSLSLTGLKSDDPFVFDPNRERYTVTIANESPELGVEAAVASGTNLSYTILDGSNVITQDRFGIASIPFNAGETKTITIVVRATNGTIKRYIVQGTREISNDASLATLQLLPEALGFSFNPANVRHTLNIPNPVVGDKATSIKLKAAGTHSDAVITMFTVNTAAGEGISADKNKIDTDISVDEGETKRIIIEVTAQDGETTKSYTVLLTRPASRDIRLRALTVEPDGAPQGFIFNPTTDTHAIRSYSIELPSHMANTTVTATAHNENARLTIRESTGRAGSPSRSASLAVMIAKGAHKDIIIEVTAQNGTTETYRVIISRASAMDRTTLGFEVELSGFILTADSLTSYIGTRMGSSSDDITASASVDVERVSVQRIWVNDNTETNYILGGTAQSLTANAATAVISSAIPLASASKIILVLRRTDNTEDGYTEASYTINIESAAVRIRTKVFLEGPLR